MVMGIDNARRIQLAFKYFRWGVMALLLILLTVWAASH